MYRQFFKVTCDDLTSNDIANLKNFVGHWRSVFRSHRTTLFAEAPQGIARSVENNVARNGPTAVGHKALRERIAQAYSRPSTVLCK